MKKTINLLIPVIVSYFFVLLFCYASISKILDFENFQVQIAQSPLLSAYAGFVSYATIISELIIVLLLLIPKSRLLGLYASLGIMSAFTVYIYLILNYSDFVPCSCGGILEKMSWTEHLIFNIGCVLLAWANIFIIEREIRLRKKTAVSTFLTLLFSCCIVVFLFIKSEHIIKKENNFTRRFLLHPVLEDKVIELDNDQYYFAGGDGTHIYLGNKHYPQTLVRINSTFEGVDKNKIVPSDLNHTFRNLQTQVKGQYYYLYDGTVPIIYRGKLGSHIAEPISYQDAYFTQLVVLDSLKFALRTQSKENKLFTVAQLNLEEEPKVKLYSKILEKQIDGVFDSDGKLTISDQSNRLMYVYTYRNEFLVISDQFDVQKKLHTIDTTKIANIKTSRQSNGVHKIIAPPLKVNLNISANRNIAFIQSDLMGKHESLKSWKKAKVIDIYRTDEQEYIGSFYIYNKGKQILSDFMVRDQYFFTIVGNELTRYTYRAPLVKYFKTGEAEKLSKE